MIEKVDDVLYADGWDDCLVGHGNIFHGSDGPKVVAIYDRDKMVTKLAKDIIEEAKNKPKEDEFFDPYLEADEYIAFNVEGAFTQAGMPVFATFDQKVDFEAISSCGCSSCG